MVKRIDKPNAWSTVRLSCTWQWGAIFPHPTVAFTSKEAKSFKDQGEVARWLGFTFKALARFTILQSKRGASLLFQAPVPGTWALACGVCAKVQYG